MFKTHVLNSKPKTYLDYPELVKRFESIDLNSIEEVLNFTSTYSIDTKSPMFLFKLYGGSNAISLLADLIISYYNTNVYVYTVSPVFTLVEKIMINRISELICSEKGYGLGLFFPGCSYCNTAGLIVARHRFDPSTKMVGSKPMSIVTSTKSHYSIDKSAIMMGVGLDRVIKVDFDLISESELEQIIVDNNVFCVCSTFGTTSEGILESVSRFRNILLKHRVWHHVDACVGGILIYSTKHKDLTLELQYADSISMDFHKIANIAVQCSALMVRSDHLADYLFHDDSNSNSNSNNADISSMSFQCGRKADAFRLFLTDQMSDMSDRIDKFIDRVDRFKKIIKQDDRFILKVDERSVTHIVFEVVGCDKVNEIVSRLRSDGVFLEHFDRYIRIVPINPLTDDRFRWLLDRISE